MSLPSVSIVIPAKNGRPTIGPCLDAVLAQDYAGAVDVLVLDSGSRDGTLDDVRARPSVALHEIPPSSFDHGDTRNLGAGLTAGELIVFLVQDAEPVGRRWLAELVSNFDDPTVAGAFSRILPRPDAGPLVQRGCQGDLCFGSERTEVAVVDPAAWRAQDPHSLRVAVNFNDVSSCVRRSVWRRLPLVRGMFGEDIRFARSALESGFRIVFDPRSEVLHSHEYEAASVRARTRIDAQMNRVFLRRLNVDSLRSALILAWRSWRSDREYLAQQALPWAQRLKWSALSPLYHLSEFVGFWQGARDVTTRGMPFESVPRALPADAPLKVLMVVHGFPPDSWAGVEVLSLTLGRALRRRGVEVVFFVRTPGTPEESDRSLHSSEFDGFVVHRFVNRLAFGGVDETYRFAPAEAAFDQVLAAERPDVVHLQHMIHLSTGLVDRCRAASVPCVVTVSDFWPSCPKVQRLRPDGSNCTRTTPGLGCAACVKGKPRGVGLLAGLDAAAGGLPLWLAQYVPQSAPARPPGPAKSLEDAASLIRRERWMADVLSRADAVVVPSACLQRDLLALGLPAGHVALSAYGMDTGWLGSGPPARVARAAGEPLRVGFIGSIVPYKGLTVLARAVARLPAGAAQIHVHGDHEGGADEVVRALVGAEVAAARQAAGEAISFHGRFEHDRLGQLHAELDVLVVPSTWQEAYGITVREAHLTGTPLLASDIAGIAEGVRDGVDGLLFPPGDDAALAACLTRLLDDPELGPRLAAAAPPVKTDDQEAAEYAWRYRQLVTRAAGRHNPEPVCAPASPTSAAGAAP